MSLCSEGPKMEAFKSDSQQLCELRFSSPQSLFSGSPVIFRGKGVCSLRRVRRDYARGLLVCSIPYIQYMPYCEPMMSALFSF